MPYLTILRHGQSTWNLENRFTGWVDVELSEQGVHEAVQAGLRLADTAIDVVFTSVLQRAVHTANLALEQTHRQALPTHRSDALNERHYGDLQGLNKAETSEKYGAEQVHLWRRSYNVPPPNGESLEQTRARVEPYYRDYIQPLLAQGKHVLIVAHGNSLRSIMMMIENLDSEQILSVELPTATPIRYMLSDSLQIVEKVQL
jgi:2,3-bisphosphoglycerate-dependent phosphoglycerate mutase